MNTGTSPNDPKRNDSSNRSGKPVDAENPIFEVSGGARQRLTPPAKLEMPTEQAHEFEVIRQKITDRIEFLGLSNPRTTDAALTLLLEVREGIVCPGFLGNQREGFEAKLNRLYGVGSWHMQHFLQGRLFDSSVAYRHYEDAYFTYFKSNPAKLDWLVSNYSNVIDNAPSNVNSGFDYSIQEVPDRGHHLHDIAVRNAVRRLGKDFLGSELLQIRGKFGRKGVEKPGYQFSPGVVPFHRSDLLPQSEYFGRQWWESGTIEDFYQRSRRLIVPVFDESKLIRPLEVQKLESYPCRVSARILLRMLPILTQETASLTEVSELPWMLDANSMPIGESGFPRKFTDQEIYSILKALKDQLEVLFEKSDRDEHLLGLWSGFNCGRKLVATVEKIAEGRRDEISGEEHELFPDLLKIEPWKVLLSHFYDYLNDSGLRPVFLARDGLAVMEYLSYRNMVKGFWRFDPDTTVHRAMYLPGTDRSSRSSTNIRGGHDIVEETTDAVFDIRNSCYDDLGLEAPPPLGSPLRAQLQAKFEEKVHALLKRWSKETADTVQRQAYELWHSVYSTLRSTLNENLEKVAVVDSDGSGKSALFVKSFMTYFATEEGTEADVRVIVGALRKKHLGVPNLAEIHDIAEPTNEGVLPDLKWPFEFARFDREPVFNMKHKPTSILRLVYRGLQFYNQAVEDESKS